MLPALLAINFIYKYHRVLPIIDKQIECKYTLNSAISYLNSSFIKLININILYTIPDTVVINDNGSHIILTSSLANTDIITYGINDVDVIDSILTILFVFLVFIPAK